MVIDPRELTFRRNPTAILEGQIDRDVACIACGYNLRGLVEAGDCPECGRAIRDSLWGDRLQFADPVWIARLARGCLLAVGSLPLVPVGVVLTGSPTPLWGPLLLIAGGILGWAGGWYMLTEPQPHRLPKAGNAMRETARWSTWAVALSVVTLLTFIATDRRQDPICILLLLSPLLMMISTFSTLVHLGNLARRVPDDSIATQAMVAASLFVAGFFFIFPLTLCGGMTGLAIATLVFTMLGGLWWVSLLLRLRKRLLRMISSET